VKWCEEVESRLKAAKEHALSQTQSIDALFKTIDDISAEARKVRLELDKLIKSRKDELRTSIVTAAQKALFDHRHGLESALGMVMMPTITADFAGSIKGKRSLDSMRDAVDTELARAKIAHNELAERMRSNIKTLKGDGHDWSFLFPDLGQVAGKPAEDFANLVAARVAKYQQDQEDARQRALRQDEERKAREAAAAAQAAQVVQQAAAPVVAAPAPVVAQRAPVASDTTIKLGDINARLAPVTLTADGLAQLGFVHVATDKSAKLYRESDFADICAALVNHINASALAVA
jgi:hypothetical protein